MTNRAVAETASPCRTPVASIEVHSPRTQFFWVSRNKVGAQTPRKVWSGEISWDNIRSVVELHIPKSELVGTSMGYSLGVFTGPKTKEQYNLYQVSCALSLR